VTDDPKQPEANALAEMLARLVERDETAERLSRSEISERAEALLSSLREALSADWPPVDELRSLPASELTALVRQLSLLIDRLTSIRLELLQGRGPRL
jgi:hypothetical protein